MVSLAGGGGLLRACSVCIQEFAVRLVKNQDKGLTVPFHKSLLNILYFNEQVCETEGLTYIPKH